MRRSRVLVLGSWIVVTALATLISAAGVSLVTRDVTSDHARALPAADVVALLGTKTSASPKTATPAPVPDASVTTPAPVTSSPPTDISPPEEPPVTAAATPPPTATFATKGGVIAVACVRAGVTLVSARPDDGYQVQVRESGPARVVVAFAAGATDVATIASGCPSGVPALVDGAPAAAPDERSRGRGRGDDTADHDDDRGDDQDDRGVRSGHDGSGRRDGNERGPERDDGNRGRRDD